MSTYTWTNSAGGTWDVAGNWSPAGGPPGANDSAVIDLTGIRQVLANDIALGDVSLTGPNTDVLMAPLPTDDSGALGTLDGTFKITSGTLSLGPDLANGSSGLTGADYTILGSGTVDNIGGTLRLDQASLNSEDTGQTIEIAPDIINDGLFQIPDGTAVTLDATTTLTNAGTLQVAGDGAGGALFVATMQSSGVITISNYASLVATALTNTGVIELSNGGTVTGSGATLDVGAVTGSGGRIEFADGVNETVKIESTGPISYTTNFASEIDGFQGTDPSTGTDTIDLAGIAYSADDTVSYSDGIMTVAQGSTDEATLKVGSFSIPTGEMVAAEDDGSGQFAGGTGGTMVVFDASCFAAGTCIRTRRGEVAVEALRIGDAVVLAGSRRHAPVCWLGHRRVDCRRHPKPWNVWPVRVRAHAFGANRPRRDLLLSPDHAVFVRAEGQGVLIPIRYLCNGVSIVQEPAQSITYWHVELPRHGVLLAEGLPAESYLDTGNRGAFANADGPVMAHPDFARGAWERDACAPLVVAGRLLRTVHARLIARTERFGYTITDEPDLRLMTADGELRPSWIDGEMIGFELPAGTRQVRLCSRRTVPAELRADTDDRRRLGVAVAALELDNAPVPLDSARFGRGWHAPEGQWRWTDGAGWIDCEGFLLLAVRVLKLERYRLPPDRLTAAARSASPAAA
jgi:hypothetical protein